MNTSLSTLCKLSKTSGEFFDGNVVEKIFYNVGVKWISPCPKIELLSVWGPLLTPVGDVV